MPKKVCTKCKKKKLISSFYASDEGRYGVRARCKPCTNAESKARAKANNYYKPKPKVLSPTGKRLTALYEQGLKECSECKVVKQLSSFSKRPTGKTYHRFDSRCDVCLKQYKREWQLKRNLDIRIFLYTYRISKGCVECGEKDPRTLEFDHLRDKKFNLGQAHMKKGITLKEVKSEVRKCVVRCANCHKRKTHKEQDTWLNTMYEQLTNERG